jgi:signal transduction histidine kinase
MTEPPVERPPLRGELVSLSISLPALVALAGAGVLLYRGGGLSQPDGTPALVLLVLAGLAVVGSFVFSFLAAQRLTERLAAMRAAAREMGAGDLSVSVPEAGDDDLTALARSLNGMAGRVARMLQAQRDLLAGVSHELRSPLTRMEVLLELLAAEDSGAIEGRRALLAELRQEMDLLEEHISRLLEAQRVSGSGAMPRRQQVDLDELVEQVVQRERHRLEQAGFAIEVACELGPCRISADANALDRLLSTLVENALRYAAMPASEGVAPALRVETERGLDGALLRVLDRGPGLDAEQCLRAFEPFYRVDPARSAATGGTGLGLYLVKRIAEAHGGRARALPRPGGGLAVEVSLPLADDRGLKQTVRFERLAVEPGEPSGQPRPSEPTAAPAGEK